MVNPVYDLTASRGLVLLPLARARRTLLLAVATGLLHQLPLLMLQY